MIHPNKPLSIHNGNFGNCSRTQKRQKLFAIHSIRVLGPYQTSTMELL